MSTSALMGLSPMAPQPLLQPFRRGGVVDAAHQAERKSAAEFRPVAEIEPHLDRAFADAGDGRRRRRPQPAQPARGEVAGDALDAGGIGPVRRQPDLDHRIVETRPGGEARTHRRVLGKIDDALMVVGELQLPFRQHHAETLDAADPADRKHRVDTGNPGARSGEGADQAGPRIGRAADHLHRRPALPGIDDEHPAACPHRDASRQKAPGRSRRASRLDLSSTHSTSRPIEVSLSTISPSEASVSRWSLSQESVNFIVPFRRALLTLDFGCAAVSLDEAKPLADERHVG